MAAAVIPWIPLITAGAQAGTQIIGAKMGANASRDATRMQTEASREALRVQEEASKRALEAQLEEQNYERYLYAAQQQARKPYEQMSFGAMTKLSDILGVPAPAARTTAPPSGMAQPTATFSGIPAPGSGGTLASTLGAPSARMGIYKKPDVTMRAPTGELQVVPAERVPYYRSKGAQVVVS